MNQYIKSIIEGFNFGNINKHDSPLQAAVKTVLKFINIKNIMEKYGINMDFYKNHDSVDEYYESVDNNNYEYVYISYNFDADVRGDEDSIWDEGEGPDVANQFIGELLKAKFKVGTMNCNNYSGLYYYIMSYPLATDKELPDFTVDDFLKYCMHYTDEQIELIYQDELEHSDTNTRSMSLTFERAREYLRNCNYFYKNVFKNLTDTERLALVNYAKKFPYFSVSHHDLYISPDSLLIVLVDLEDPQQKYDSDDWTTSLTIEISFLDSALKNKDNPWDSRRVGYGNDDAYKRVIHPEYKGWETYTKYYYYNNLWQEMHGDRINDYEEYKKLKENKEQTLE